MRSARYFTRDVFPERENIGKKKKMAGRADDTPALVGPCKRTGNRSTLIARTIFFKLMIIEPVRINLGSSSGGCGPYLIQKPSTKHASAAAMWGGGGGLFSSPRGGSMAQEVSVLYMNPLQEGSSCVAKAMSKPS